MIIAVASGKGGTGKTTVSASLASVWEKPVTAIDLDVEEPNLHHFLKPEIEHETTAYMEVPVADEEKCTHCGLCSEICQFKAISVLGDVLLIYPEMCHGCRGCIEVCPEDVLSPGKRELGVVGRGTAGQADFFMGRLRVGEAMSPPLMKAVRRELAGSASEEKDIIIDSPPGVSCPAVNAVMGSDVIVLVTEPTPFGFHDFKLAYEAFKPLGKNMGAVINRAGLGDDSVYRFCKEKNLEIIAEIPFDRAIAEAYSKGGLVAEASPDLNRLFKKMAERVKRLGTGKPDSSLEAQHA